MAEKDFKYDPEAGEDTKKLRLPFAICKARGIEIKDWWTPRDAWAALQNRGLVSDVSEEYADYYRKLKRERQKEFDKAHPERVAKRKARAETKKRQLADNAHNPDKNYIHKDGFIAGVQKGEPMSFEQADSGSVNPFIGKQDEKTGHEYIGYRTNCQTCVATYVARRKGYNVRALPNLDNSNVANLSFNTSLAYLTKDGQHPVQKQVKFGGGASSVAMDMPPNSIYSLQFDYIGRSSGHIVIMEKDAQGKVTLYDPQINRTYDMGELKGYSKGKSNFKTMDLTNVSLDEKFCDTIMKKV